MYNDKSQKKLKEYRCSKALREGLSFSDYFDDSIPYEVKPVPSTIPMEEDVKVDELSNLNPFGWMDQYGKYYCGDQHYYVGEYVLNLKNIEYDENDVYLKMYELGYIKIVINYNMKILYFTYYTNKPTDSQLKKLKRFCLNNKYKLEDSTAHKTVYIDESLIKNKDPLSKESSSLKNYGDDYPNRAKDLYKGLWEENNKLNFIVYNNRDYWMNPKGDILRAVYGHEDWAMNYLDKNGIKYDIDDGYEPNTTMFNLGFIRLKPRQNRLYFECFKEKPPTAVQMRNLKDAAIMSDMSLFDDSDRGRNTADAKQIDLSESSIKQSYNNNKILFILENMMPENMDIFKSHLAELFDYLQKKLQLKTIPKLKLNSDEKNAEKVLGKTAYYDPDTKTVVLFITNRHQKDILRSFSHEVIHHWQHENQKLENGKKNESGNKDPQYAQNDPWLRQMEKQAYLLGNMLFRDWEDQKKAKDKKLGRDGKGGNKNVKEQHGKGNVRFDSLTPIMKQKYPLNHSYRANTEGPQDGELEDIEERTYSLGNEYPPKKMSYKG